MERHVKQGTPFRRAMLMMAAIQAAMSLPTHLQQSRLTEIGPYESRGKGRGGPNRIAAGAGKANHRAAMKRRNVLRHRKACRG